MESNVNWLNLQRALNTSNNSGFKLRRLILEVDDLFSWFTSHVNLERNLYTFGSVDFQYSKNNDLLIGAECVRTIILLFIFGKLSSFYLLFIIFYYYVMFIWAHALDCFRFLYRCIIRMSISKLLVCLIKILPSLSFMCCIKVWLVLFVFNLYMIEFMKNVYT